MSLEQLESFVAVAESGAVVRAARRLHLTQPPLTRRIQSLEDELGVPLFLRAARGMALTAAGERLLPRARQILAAVAEVRAAARAEVAAVQVAGREPPGG
jgi:DNA-binding transcriptional LysR family regulator